MSFIAKRNKSGTVLEINGAGGTLNVLSGKAKASSIKARKDDGKIKKGDTIEGVEFAFEIAESGNIEGQIYQQATGDEKYGKYVPDTQPLVFPLKCSLFVSGECGQAYLALFANAEKLGLPEGIQDGFKGQMTIGENKHTAALVAGDFSKAVQIVGMLLDGCEKVTCAIDFPTPYSGGNGGGKSQSEAEKLSDRIKFVEALLTDASTEQLLFVKLLGIDGEITHREFIALMFT
jgi:hypothetical protein